MMAFPLSISARIAESVYGMLREDIALAAHFRTLKRAEIEEVFRDRYTTPALGVIIEATSEERRGTTTILETYLMLGMITEPVSSGISGPEVWQRDCVVAHIRQVLNRWPGGAIRDFEDQDRWIAQGLTRFERVPLTGQIQGGTQIITPIRVIFTTDLSQATREIL